MPIESVTYTSVPIDCQRSTSGGKGNLGMFIERAPNICAAGIPSSQPDYCVEDCLQHYLLKDEADCLISDAIFPPPKPRQLPPLRKPIPLDLRHAGIYGKVAQLINPPTKTRFQTIVDDFKDTVYKSYWKWPLGKVQDPVPMLPEGFDTARTTFGKATASHDSLYDVVMPKDPLPDKTPRAKQPGVQTQRNFCKPAFDPDLIYGHRTYVDKRGRYAKCCLTDDRVILGNANKAVIASIQADFLEVNQPMLGTSSAPNDNIKVVPEGYTFGTLKVKTLDNISECLTGCDINPGHAFFRKCLSHLNSVRKCLSTRFLPGFFHGFYLNLKYIDKEKSGWLPKDVVYSNCQNKLIRFDPTLIEPLLSMWNAFDGSRIKYKKFVYLINYREPSPDIPKIPDLPDDCLDFRTTYTEMVKPGQKADNRLMAGRPSGRYLDLDYPVTPTHCCKADRVCLPEESDCKSCLSPSILTLLHVSHRDMYQAREPDVVKRVFEATGEKFDDEQFMTVWSEAQKYHPNGLVCFETFRRAFEHSQSASESSENKKS